MQEEKAYDNRVKSVYDLAMREGIASGTFFGGVCHLKSTHCQGWALGQYYNIGSAILWWIYGSVWRNYSRRPDKLLFVYRVCWIFYDRTQLLVF